MLVYIGTITFPFLLPGSTKWKTCRHMNSLFQHGYISKLLTSKADAQYSKATQTRLHYFKTIIQTQNKMFFT